MHYKNTCTKDSPEKQAPRAALESFQLSSNAAGLQKVEALEKAVLKFVLKNGAIGGSGGLPDRHQSVYDLSVCLLKTLLFPDERFSIVEHVRMSDERFKVTAGGLSLPPIAEDFPHET